MVVCELLAVVCGDCVDRELVGTQQSDRGRVDRHFRFLVHLSQQCVFRGPINQRHECSTVPFTDNGVGLPVADPHLFLHYGRALRNVHSAKDMAPTGMASAFPVWLLAAPSKSRPQVTASLPIRMNEIVNLLPTYWSPFQLKTTADLFRAQAFPQLFFYLSSTHRCKSPRDGRGSPVACLCLLLRLLVTVTRLSAVAPDLSVDCCSVTAHLLRNQAG